MLVNAPMGDSGSGIVATDRLGAAGNHPTADCTDYVWAFAGTSMAAPMASGVVALMLQANPALNWRDVQHVLVETAVQNDPTDADWLANAAGYTANHAYGFGRIDAAAAADLAADWETVPGDTTLSSGVRAPGDAIPDGDTLSTDAAFTDPDTENLVIEHVELRANVTHPRRGDIGVRLVAPGGKASVLMTPRSADGNADFADWTFMSVHHWGESTLGDWTLEVTDNASGQTGTLDDWELVFYGFPALSNDLFAHATDIGRLGRPYTDTARTIRTTTELAGTWAGAIDDPDVSCDVGIGQAHRTLWYTYTPRDRGYVTFDTVGSDYDTVLSVWTGSPPTTEVACDNDGGRGNTSSVTMRVTAGTTYYILVSGYDMGYGNLVFNARHGRHTSPPWDDDDDDHRRFVPWIRLLGLPMPGWHHLKGQVIRWIITVQNQGTGTGRDVAVTDALRNDLQIDRVDAADPLRYVVRGQTITVTIPALDPGESTQFDIYTTVTTGGEITNRACIGDVCAEGWVMMELPETGVGP
jgi:subtilisin-like proprotein convertase family protein